MDANAHGARCLVLLADPALGVISPSWRSKEALEEAGYAVFWFTPRLWPQLFADGVAQLGYLDALMRRWAVDAVVVADGLSIDTSACVVQAPRLVVLASREDELARSLERMRGAAPDTCWVLDGMAAPAARELGCAVRTLGTVPDLSALDLANEIVYPRGLSCAQEATPERIELMRAAAQGMPEGTPVRCAGEGWPDEWRFDGADAGAAYALGFTSIAVRFPSSEGRSAYDEYVLQATKQFAGADILRPDAGATGAWMAERAAALLESRRVRASIASTADDAPFGSVRAGRGDAEGMHAARGGFERSVVHAAEALGVEGASFEPCRVATVLGYVGCGNFGDEYILSTIAERLEERCPGTVSVAVSENPWHTLVHRGVYAIALASKRELDGMLARSSVALVMAGLLFDQGIRWTMGKAEIASSVLHSDIPGIAAFVELAALNDTPVVLYGIGAGPLERTHSKRLVRLMGSLGARFACRDEETARLVSACDVPAGQVVRRADVAFTGSSHVTEAVDSWFANQELDPVDTDLIVVSLREYENVSDDFAERVARACDRVLASRPRAHLAFAMLDAADRGISDRVVEAMSRIDRVHLFSAGDDIDAMADFIGRATAGLSMRYHASLLMFRGGIPCVGLGYLPKVCALYEEAHMGSSLLAMDASADEIADALGRALDEREALARIVQEGVANLRELAQQGEDELVELVGETSPACEQDNGCHELYLYREAASDRMLVDERRRAEASERHAADVERELAEARQRVVDLEQSNSYRIGSALMYLPGLLKHRRQ
ncbi:polysaccharide pyruvyl transferase family protein [Collinsella ihumii]|uniref:Polysaccharide pyruvyl transferase family protein n=1 Tax=Collinsella ihumii TaxID=1720204 RepID=A0ABT7XHA2_9ACTN|nr:polysaccharide pyruvyl transferase family protein [Collinsella ihumii]MDN0064792.1 polysaccharide pyruvyl transferase family protein [Collinsella ihumii]